MARFSGLTILGHFFDLLSDIYSHWKYLSEYTFATLVLQHMFFFLTISCRIMSCGPFFWEL